jgi:hypothetical protein
MRKNVALLFIALIVAAAARAQQAQAPPPAAKPTEAAGEFELYQVDLVPTGSGFAVTKPVLEGDVWVFKVWPDRSTVRLAQSKVKKITPRTKQLQSETAWRIDLAPSGQIFSRDNPVLKGTTYTFHRWRGGDLMSLRQSDVKKITKLTPVEIFQTHLQYFGPKPIGNLAMEGGTVVMPAEPAPQQGTPTSGGAENWIYYGTPGVDDAWSPGNAEIAYPGDVPKAPNPR